MLNVNPNKRITAKKIITHPWIVKESTVDNTMKINVSISTTLRVLEKMQKHQSRCLLRKKAKDILIRTLAPDQTETMAKIFKKFDYDKDGFIEPNDLDQALSSTQNQSSDSQVIDE